MTLVASLIDEAIRRRTRTDQLVCYLTLNLSLDLIDCLIVGQCSGQINHKDLSPFILKYSNY